jgi:hypothetical protein
MKINESIELLSRAVVEDLRAFQLTNNISYETRMSIKITQRIY